LVRCLNMVSFIAFSISDTGCRHFCVPNRKSKIENLKSLDHPVRPREHAGRNDYGDLLGRFEINNQI
jgi:hypothetical protein